jgi:hypothetical protein
VTPTRTRTETPTRSSTPPSLTPTNTPINCIFTAFTQVTTNSVSPACCYYGCVKAQWVHPFYSATGGVCFIEFLCTYTCCAVPERSMALKLGSQTAVCLKWSNSAWDSQPFAWEGTYGSDFRILGTFCDGGQITYSG